MGRPDKSVKRPKKKGTDEVKCSGCGTFLGFADNIMYPIGTTEGMCHWCEEKVTKDMTEPKLELDHIFDSERLIPDERITIVLDGKLILTHGLTAFDMPMIHSYTVKYFKLLEYSYNKFPILQFTKDHYQMKNGWKITLEHWWIPNVPLSERYYAHDIHVPRSSKEEHDDWTNGDWKINLLKFDYLSDDYEMQAWIHRLPEIGIPLQNVPVKDIVEFTPPEPETNICPICGDVIPDDTLRSPNFLCEKCKRPIACVSCKEEVLEAVGITECPWCHTDAESTEKIKHAIRVRKEKEEYETQKASDEIWTTDNAKISMVSARTDQFLDFPEHGEGTPYSSMTHAIAGIKDQEVVDEYPYRDGPDAMSKKGGWGVPFDIQHEESPLVTPTETSIELLKEEAQRGTGRSTQRRLSAMNHFFDRVSGKVHMGRSALFIVDNQRMAKDTRSAMEDLYMHNYNMGSGVYETIFKKNLDIITIHEFSSRLPHGKHYTMVVLDLVAPLNRDRAKFIKMEISVYGCPIIGGESIVETEGEDTPDPDPTKYNVTEQTGFQPKIVLNGEEIPVTDVKYTVNQNVQPVYAVGERRAVGHSRGPTTVEGTFKGVVGLPANEKATYGDMVKSEYPTGDNIVGYAVDAATKDGAIAVYKKGDNDIVKVRLVEPGRVFKPGDLVYNDDIIPRDDHLMKRTGGAIPTTSKPKRIPSRKEKPPRTALICLKCGQIPDDCTCGRPSRWKRFLSWLYQKFDKAQDDEEEVFLGMEL